MTSSSKSRTVTPRSVANKDSAAALLDAIHMALEIESSAVRHNTQTFNRNRYSATALLPDYQALKDRARAIKERSIQELPQLLLRLEESVRGRGGHFYLAANAAGASRYISDVCRRSGVRLVVKGKSMTSEEVGLNHALEAAGIEVAETDLAEFILQIADEQPSHIVGPALHYSRERITALFKRKFETDLPLDTGEELTAFARAKLREKFLNADAGISGANLIAADSGTLVLIESEANIRMASFVPPLYIAIAGVEKVVATRQDLAPFIELLAASATGQPMTSYTSIISPPLPIANVFSDERAHSRQFHLVLVDNGRMAMRDDPVLQEALCCIRCGACLNSCANFQTVGGHAFGGATYSGGIGGSWEAGTKGLEYARFSELCTGCSRCVPQCPVEIDIPWLNVVLRQRLSKHDGGVSLQKRFFGHYDMLGKWASRASALLNRIAAGSRWVVDLDLNRASLARIIMEKVAGVSRQRQLPAFAAKTLVQAGREAGVSVTRSRTTHPGARAVLFADVFTNYGSPERGLAALRVLRSVGIDVVVSEVSPDGRAALSQGLISAATDQANRTAKFLSQFIAGGRDVIVVEPSVLSMFRLDYRHLLTGSESEQLFQQISRHSFDSVEYLWRFLLHHAYSAAERFPASRHPLGVKIFYHSHCQQKTVGSAEATPALLRAAGFDVVTSQVECCGMAGSFGYKKEFYELSMAVGQDLLAQIRKAEAESGPRVLVATGTSCQEQLRALLNRPALHPMELLAGVI